MGFGPLFALLLIGALETCFATTPQPSTDVIPRFLIGSSEPRKPKLRSLHYENCGGVDDPGKLLELSINQQKDGDVVVTASGSTDVDIKPPMKVVVKLSKRAMGMWIDVPCIKQLFGSCTIPDICKFGFDECPFKPLKEANIPCRCPIQKGKYSIKMAELPVPRTTKNGLLSGTYRARVNIYNSDNTRFACYNGTVAIS